MFSLFVPEIPYAIKRAKCLKQASLTPQIRLLETLKVSKLGSSPAPLLSTRRENAFFYKDALICGNFLISLAQSMCKTALFRTVSAF